MAASTSETNLNAKKPRGRARWDILRSAIVDKKVISSGDYRIAKSIRQFDSFELFIRKQCNCLNKQEKRVPTKYSNECNWFSYTCKDISRCKDLWIQHPSSRITIEELTNFNNTGNICIWPAEEVLAYYCCLHIDKFAYRSVVELGGGSSCLAGMCVALNSKSPQKVLLTDGNPKCIDSIRKTINMNFREMKGTNVLAGMLRWDEMNTYRKYSNSFDFVICADCLFFDNGREQLAGAIHYLLKPGGVALVFAPRRGKTMGQFVTICQEKFSHVSESDHYCHLISSRHQEELQNNKHYNPDIHFPLLIELTK